MKDDPIPRLKPEEYGEWLVGSRECLLGSEAGEKYPSCAKYPDCICGGPPDQPGCTHE